MTQIRRLKHQSSVLFFLGKFRQGYEVIKQCIEVQPTELQHYINKALYQHKLGNTKVAVIDLNKAIGLDCLYYQAYFNLFSIQMQLRQYQAAFKNICCCLSIAYLLRAERSNSLDDVDKSIQYSFNNKQARLFKSLIKIQAKKNIQALNSINYALYLAPANPHLKEVQEKVYKLMGMKELKANNTQGKQKFDRLQTNKEIPTPQKIQGEIDKLLKEFNKILKSLDTKNLFKIKIQPKIENKVIFPVQPKIIKKLSPKFYLEASENKEQNVISLNDTFKEKNEKESTANNSQHVLLANRQEFLKLNGQNLERNQHFFLQDSSFSNLSISNIQQNSNIKMNKYKQSLGQRSIGSISNVLDSSINEQGLLTLPLRASQLKGKQLIVTLHRTVQNQRGEKEQIEQHFNVIQTRNRFQLIKIEKQR